MAKPMLLAAATVPIAPVRGGYALRVDGLLRELTDHWRVVFIGPPDGEAETNEKIEFERRFDLPADLIPEKLSAQTAAIRDGLAGFIDEVVTLTEPDVCLLWPGLEFVGFDDRPWPPFLVDRIDCQALTLWRRLFRGGGSRGWLGTLSDLVGAAGYERRLARTAAATVVVGEDDAKALRRLSGRRTVYTVPNGVHVADRDTEDVESPTPTVTFTGVMDFDPNIDAVLHFADRVWPTVRAAVPTAEFLVAGRRPTPAVVALSDRDGVTVEADVPDMMAVIRRSWICVAPMCSGSGIKNKVLEAWSCSKPVVLSRMASNGLQLDEQTRAYVTSSPAEMAARTIDLLQSADRRRCIGRASLELARAHHSWRRAAEELSDLLQRAARTGRTSG